MRRVPAAALLLGVTVAAASSDGVWRQASSASHASGDFPRLAARWILSTGTTGSGGAITWPVDPRDPGPVNHSLYAGTPGVVLFMTELARVTGDTAYRDAAVSGARAVAAALDQASGVGLWEGRAGMAYALVEASTVASESEAGRLRARAHEAARHIVRQARRVGRGVEWDGTTDIISGAAGTGLFLIRAARAFEDPALLQTAAAAADRLLEIAIPEGPGLKWAMDPKYPRLMPNFAHGTAGVACFLAMLAIETGRADLREAAIKGARYLQSIAKTDGDICLIFHHEPDGKDLYYLGWCHGPVGTARLFHALRRATGDAAWTTWVERAARSILVSGIPERQTPGFWNNVGQCCGSAGVIEFFLDLHAATGRDEYLRFARRVADDVRKRATVDAAGARWVQAEHRARPELLVAQTGYMQGAAGIGMALLRLDGVERGRRWTSRLPDNPF